ncbi:hypothetical protein K9B35_07720 [Sphingomonas sp. R647]|uniref:hypothetical protein n=1 Tax=Sphingomonas sp. R647 TaxID=2875233 RepID=UPI001CD1F713|nr:hypothetical protein [Sphingomonas sp. R647]MCA1197851.1 hypothetical protein [Sphingomonas sp. R647]
MSNLRDAALERYRRWNGAIYTVLFSEPRAQTPVYLYLETDLLASAALLADVPAPDARTNLIASVSGALGWDQIDTPFLWHLAEADVWASDGMREPPPFLALLAVLVLGAEAMVTDTQHAAHNYYSRLLALLEPSDTLAARIRRHFKDTVELWQLLNDWLLQWDGELGLPSAQVTDRRVNIGYPISQALVSAQDRLRLGDAFEEYGLRPGRRMAPLEMEQYLDHWLSHSGAPTRLKRLWGNEEVRRRITLIACGELEAWAGPAMQVAQERASGRVPLLWRGDLTAGALPAIDLFLACQADQSRVIGSYRIVDPTDATGREGLARADGRLEIAAMRGSELCALEPWSALLPGALLAGAFTLAREESATALVSRSPNPILVLTYDERDALWHEVTRAQLLERCIVLAHADILAKVEPHLERYARPGYQKHDSRTLDGLPDGWVAFLEVMLADSPENEALGVLAALSPLRADVITLDGGLRLGRQTWHADALPELAATLASERPLRLAIEQRRTLDEGTGGLPVAVADGRASLTLAGLGMASGDYLATLDVAEAKGSSRRVDEVAFRLRTASHPRPLRSQMASQVGYLLDAPRGLVTATPLLDDDAPFVQGALLEGEALTFPEHAPSLATALAPALAPPPAREKILPASAPFAMPCALRGHHHWIIDRAAPEDNRYTLKHMECQDCHREEWRRSGPMRRAGSSLRRAPGGLRQPERPRARLPAAGPRTWSRPTLALMLDALSYIGSGSWAMLREMTQSLAPDQPYLAPEAARALAALGHLDIALDPRTQRPASWQVAPATLVEASDASWVLAGSRSDRLVGALLAAAGTAASIEGEAEGLPVVRIRPNDPDALLEIVTDLEEQGFLVAISERFSERLAQRLVPLEALLPAAELFRLGGDRVERLDLGSRQWIDAGDGRGAGAYRVQHYARLCGVVQHGEDGMMRITDPLSAKHIAAAQAGTPLVAYDPVGGVLSVPIGAELPGLLDRVATLCSGAPALVRRDSWSIQYLSVPPEVAGHIQRSLGL